MFDRHHGFYGAPRVHQELRATGLKVGRHRVARLMRCSALKAKTRRGFSPCRNTGNRASGAVENLLQQEFSPAAPNRCWAGDITYIRTTAGWRYQAVWIDLPSRRVVGWAMGATMATSRDAPEVKPLLSDEHFSVDGTLLQVWASHASLERIDGQPPCPDRGLPRHPSDRHQGAGRHQGRLKV